MLLILLIVMISAGIVGILTESYVSLGTGAIVLGIIGLWAIILWVPISPVKIETRIVTSYEISVNETDRHEIMFDEPIEVLVVVSGRSRWIHLDRTTRVYVLPPQLEQRN